MATNRITEEDVDRLGPKARAQVDAHRPRPKAPAPKSRPRASSGPKDPKPGMPAGKAPPTRPKLAKAGKALGSAGKAGKALAPKGRPLIKVPHLLTVHPRRTLVAEFVGGLILITGGQVGAGELPAPTNYLAWTIVFLVLALAQEMGFTRPAAGFGALLLVALLMAHGNGIVTVLDYLSGGAQSGGQQQQQQGTQGGGGTPPTPPPVPSLKSSFLGGD